MKLVLNYIVRTLAGGAVGYVFGLAAGGVIMVWSIVNHSSSPQNGADVVGFMFVLSFQSALVGGLAGLTSARTRGWDILWSTIPIGSLMGLVVIVSLLAASGWKTGPNSEYLLGTSPARNVASVNMIWGGLVGFIVGISFVPFFKPDTVSQSPSPTLPDQDGLRIE